MGKTDPTPKEIAYARPNPQPRTRRYAFTVTFPQSGSVAHAVASAFSRWRRQWRCPVWSSTAQQ